MPASFPPSFGKATPAKITSVSGATYSGTAAAGSVVSILRNGSKEGTAAANASGTWSYTFATAPGVGEAITAAVVDGAGTVNLFTGKPPMIRGLNLVGNFRYIGATTWPTTVGMDYYLNRGFNGFRLQTMWQNFLTITNSVVTGSITSLVESRLQAMDSVISYLTGKGAYVIIELHQGGRFWYIDAEGMSRASSGSVSGTTFTSISGSAPRPGQLVSGAGVTAGTRMIAQLTSNGGTLGDYGNGTYQLDRSSTTSGNVSITGTPGRIIGETSLSDGKDPTAAQFANVWAQIATRYKNNPLVIFELQNEPHDQNTDTLVTTYNTAIAAIRAAGALNLIKIDGNNFAEGSNWTTSVNGQTSSGVAMLNIVDSANNYCFALHEYWDGAGGALSTCLANQGGGPQLSVVTAWARTNNKKLFLGEFGGGSGLICLDNQRATLDYLEANADVWVGWTYLGAFAGQAPFSTPDTFFFNTDPGVDIATGSVDFTRGLKDPRLALFEDYVFPRRSFTLMDLSPTKLKCWLRPNTPVAGATFTWPDGSGNGRDFTQATGAKQPTVYKTDGTHVDGIQQATGQTLGSAISSGPSAGTEIVFVVYSIPTFGGTRSVVSSNPAGPGRQVQVNADGSLQTNNQGAANMGAVNAPGAANNPVSPAGQKTLIAWRCSPNGGVDAASGITAYATANGALEDINTRGYGSTGFTGTGTTVLGPLGNATSVGRIHELAICDGTLLTYTEFYRIVGRLAADHGISLMSGHPFTLAPPLR